MKKKSYSTKTLALLLRQNNYLYRTAQGDISVVRQTYQQCQQDRISPLDEAADLFKSLIDQQVSFANVFPSVEMWK